MESKSYRKKRCPRCKKLVSVNGVAWASHMKSHDRRAKQKSKAKKKKEVIIDLRVHPFAMIGEEPVGGQPQKTWQMPNLEREFPLVKSLSQYYITTGEAILKLDKYVEHLQDRLKKARKLRQKLMKSKGGSKYLETAWESESLVCKQKDPRKPRET